MNLRRVALRARDVVLLVSFFCVLVPAVTGSAAESDPLIAFQEEEADTFVYRYFDTADSAMAVPVEFARIPSEKKSLTLGVFNGVLYTVGESRALRAIELSTGKDLVLEFNVPIRHIHEGPIVFFPPEENGEGHDGKVLDLRGPMVRPVSLPTGDATTRLLSGNGLYYLYYTIAPLTPGDSSETFKIDFSLLDLKKLDSAPDRFQVTVRRTWSVVPDPASSSAGHVVVRSSEQYGPPPVVWLKPGQFAFVALAVDFEGIAWEGSTDGGSTLFVVDLATRTGRMTPLSTMPLQEVTSPGKGTYGQQGYMFDAATLTPVERSGDRKPGAMLMLGEHFRASVEIGKVLHGTQALTLGKELAIRHSDVDESGERILVHLGKGGACYDIYEGFYAACVPHRYFEFVERHEMRRAEFALPEGWTSLLKEHLNVSTVPPVQSTRKDRAAHYALAASTDKPAYEEGESVVIQVSLTHIGTAPWWTDPPASDYPILTGTLAGPPFSETVGQIPGMKPVPSVVPVYLEPGGVLTTRLEFIPEAPGQYTLALAYGGNPESEWVGRAKAPLLRFTVGQPGLEGDARLRFAIKNFIERRGKMQDKLFDELRAAGEAGEDVLIEVLKETPLRLDYGERMMEDQNQIYWSTVTSLYGYLRDRRSPRLAPFFASLLESDSRDMKYNGLFGLEELHKRTKDPAFKVELEGMLRNGYADDTPLWKARTDAEFGFVLFPTLYEDLKVQAESENMRERLDALAVLAEVYLPRRDTFAGDTEKYISALLSYSTPAVTGQGVRCLENFYRRKVDLANVQRAIDDYRHRYPHLFTVSVLEDENELWDMAWLLRTAEEPTEARFALLRPSLEALENFTGIARPGGFPASWAELQGGDGARVAFADTLKAWAEYLRAHPASFRVPELKR